MIRPRGFRWRRRRGIEEKSYLNDEDDGESYSDERSKICDAGRLSLD